MLTEIRIESLGAIPAATAEFDSGLTVLTGETGAGKTMVVTSLHLLGGARADANRVRAGADRAVVEGRFLTADPLGAEPAEVTEVLDSSGAQRDDDGSVIAARSVTSDGRSRAYLGGRSVPAKSLASFTAGLLTVHGQNDQLRLMRPEQQLAALDKFASDSIEALLTTYRKLREEWLAARRDLIDRTNRVRELAQEADRLGFALNEIDTVDPKPGRTTNSRPIFTGCPNSTRCGTPRPRHVRHWQVRMPTATRTIPIRRSIASPGPEPGGSHR